MGTRIIDIAKIAAVSPSTVSLVLNERPGVREQRRVRILKIAKELDYRTAKPPAQAAISGKSVCFLRIARRGHAVNRDHDVFIADYIEGLGQAARQLGLSLGIMTFKATPREKIIELAQGHDAAGIIVLGTELSTEDVEVFAAVEKPIVFIDTYHDFLDFDFVDMNNQDSVHRGHRSMGIVKGALETRNLKLREEGFIASLARYGIAHEGRYAYAVDSTFHGAYDDMRVILQRGTVLVLIGGRLVERQSVRDLSLDNEN